MDDRKRLRHGLAVAGLVLASGVLGAAAAFREAPWEDEFNSLHATESLFGYRLIPLSFLWLIAGNSIDGDFHFLRLWCFLPWLAGLPLADRLLRRLGAPPREALLATALLALNPWLVNECRSIRYYACFWLSSIVALHAAASLRERPGGPWRQVLLLGTILLPQAVIYSAFPLVGILLAWVACPGAGRPRVHRGWLLAIGLVPVAVVAYAMRAVLREIAARGLGALADLLPIKLGYSKPLPDVRALAFQYEQLLGFNYLSWSVPDAAVDWASLALAALAAAAFAARSGRRARLVMLALVLVPVLVWAAAPIANMVGTRYYLYSALPLAWAMAWLVGRMLARIPDAARRGTAMAIAAPLLASLVTSLFVRSDPPTDRLADSLRDHGVRELAVEPAWYAPYLALDFARRGLPVTVGPARAAQSPEARPEWVFRKHPAYTWREESRPSAGARSDGSAYEPVAEFVFLKKYYFHPVRQRDQLLRRRGS